MRHRINEIQVRTALTKTGIPGRKYCVNPYVGCTHACKYCYATFMKKFTGHIEQWGSFVDVKINAAERLEKQLQRAKKGDIIMSSVTDPYQPAEKKYMITRKCLEIIAACGFHVDILTKSPLILRDIDIISKMDAEAGLTITTDDDRIRRTFEPGAPSITARIEALRALHKKGVDTYVFIGPVLPMDPEALAREISPFVNSVLIDRMNYESKVKWLYKKLGMEKWLDDTYIAENIQRLKKGFSDKQVEVC